MSTAFTVTHSPVHLILNRLIGDFWSGTIQHQAHVAILRGLGASALAKAMKDRIADEPITITRLTDRLLDLDGRLDFEVAKPSIGQSLSEVLTLDLAVQQTARPLLNQAAEAVATEHDAVTRKLIEDVLEDEEEHLAWLKNEVSLLDRLGEPAYLALRA